MRKTRPTSTTYLDWLNPSKRRGYRNTLLGWRRCLCLGRRRCPRRRHSRSQSAISVITYTLGGSLGYSLVSLSTKLRSLPLYSFSLSHSLSLSCQIESEQRCLAWLSAPLFFGALFLLLKLKLKPKRKAKVKLFGIALSHCSPPCSATTVRHSFAQS